MYPAVGRMKIIQSVILRCELGCSAIINLANIIFDINVIFRGDYQCNSRRTRRIRITSDTILKFHISMSSALLVVPA